MCKNVINMTINLLRSETIARADFRKGCIENLLVRASRIYISVIDEAYVMYDPSKAFECVAHSFNPPKQA